MPGIEGGPFDVMGFEASQAFRSDREAKLIHTGERRQTESKLDGILSKLPKDQARIVVSVLTAIAVTGGAGLLGAESIKYMQNVDAAAMELGNENIAENIKSDLIQRLDANHASEETIQSAVSIFEDSESMKEIVEIGNSNPKELEEFFAEKGIEF